LSDTALELNFGRRYGLIGPNGSGKSTLLKCIAARDIPVPEHIDIFHLSEESAPSESTAIRAVIEKVEREYEVIFQFLIFSNYYFKIDSTKKKKN